MPLLLMVLQQHIHQRLLVDHIHRIVIGMEILVVQVETAQLILVYKHFAQLSLRLDSLAGPYQRQGQMLHA